VIVQRKQIVDDNRRGVMMWSQLQTHVESQHSTVLIPVLQANSDRSSGCVPCPMNAAAGCLDTVALGGAPKSRQYCVKLFESDAELY
jgi:hypothetical protein